MIKNDQISLIVNTTEGKQAIRDSYTIRREALRHKVCYTTTIAGGRALVMAMRAPWIDNIYRLQDIHEEVAQ
jgi:carbamoyl-phosphate synthase large subunit